ncbi:MAG: RDD family protein, partial [Actinomycetota bacterium]|nr:RDD family protein [Actinomycetota bacterium]
GFRTTLANADTLVERAVRGVLRRPARVAPESGLELVLAGESDEDTTPLRVEVEDLAARRAAWRDLPIDPPPPGRSFTYGGVATRLLALTIDIGGVGYLTSQVLTTTINLLVSLFGELPTGLTGFLYLVASWVVPIYLGLCYWGLGRTFGMAVVGLKVCTPDGRRPGFIRAMLRAWIGLFGILIWFVTGVGVFFDTKRRTLLDRLAHTEVRYSVPENQQRRHIRDAIEELRGQAGKMARQEERDRANAQALLELGEQPASGPAGAPAPMGDLDGS